MAKKRLWKTRIKRACTDAGTYSGIFDNVIDSLASILEKRDSTEEEFVRTGSLLVVEYTNKGGATNTVKNPLLVLWMELNTQALSYWRELGLTPAGLKKLDDGIGKTRKVDALSEALKDIGI